MEIADNSATISVIFGSNSASSRASRLANLALTELDKGLNQFTGKSYELAIESFNKAIRLAPGSDTAINAYDYKARTQLSQGNTQGAIESYQAALKIDPKRDDLYSQLGNIYTLEERYADAAAQYELAVKNNPSAANRYSLGQGYLGIGRLDEARLQFEQVRQLSPKDPFGNFGLGQVYARQERFDFAIEAFDAAIAIKSDYWEAYAEKGFALVDSGDAAQALDIAETLVSNDETLAAQLSQYIFEKSRPKMTAAYSSEVYAPFLSTLGPGTPLAGLNAYLSSANAEVSLSMVFQFSKPMDRASVENAANWTIERAIGSGLGDGYNLQIALPDTEVAVASMPYAVYYDSDEMTATVMFKVSQNATGNGTIDPSHINFSFSGKDTLGLTMDESADMYSGFSSFA
jgi:tetratricopeptide (TPR) repeat protein